MFRVLDKNNQRSVQKMNFLEELIQKLLDINQENFRYHQKIKIIIRVARQISMNLKKSCKKFSVQTIYSYFQNIRNIKSLTNKRTYFVNNLLSNSFGIHSIIQAFAIPSIFARYNIFTIKGLFLRMSNLKNTYLNRLLVLGIIYIYFCFIQNYSKVSYFIF
ncbi:unnamed protein product [Paramecium octaurelia]|uniref:Transmembrane protein n=1 Tax=Paramecium octaurelia TaxID=43137 RepID=A0A8S1U431_PAROT|nr:unnamed protein product [Paramecium octaurelia]